MTDEADPERLIDSPSNDLLASALRGAREDVPTEDRIQAMLLRFPSTPGGGGGEGGDDPGGGGGGGGSPALPRLPVSPFAKALIGGTLVTAVGVSTYFAVNHSSTGGAPASSASVGVSASVSSVALASASVAVSVSVSASASPSSSATVANPVVAPPPASSSAEVAPPDELILLRQAQGAVSSNPSHAIELLDQHARFYPKSQMAEEREVIRIQALIALGRNSEAAERVHAFEARHPGSAHNQRLEDMIHGGAKP